MPLLDDATTVLPAAEFITDWLTYVYNRRINASSLGLNYSPVYKLDPASTNSGFLSILLCAVAVLAL